MRTLIWSSHFSRSLRRKLRQNPPLRQPIEMALHLLADDPFHPSLHSHKLKGDLAGTWACTVDFDNRILFEFVADPTTGQDAIHLLPLAHTTRSIDPLPMTDTANRVDNLSKLYHIGMLQQRHDTTSASLSAGLCHAWAGTGNAAAHFGFSPNVMLRSGLYAQWQHIISNDRGGQSPRV